MLASVWWSLGSGNRRDMGPENLSCVRNFDKRNSSWPFGVPWKPPPRLPSPGSARIICLLAAASRRWGVWGGKFSNLDECFIDIEFLGSPWRPGTFLVSTIVYLGLRAYLAKPVMPQLQATKKVEPLQKENSIVHGNYSRFAFPPPDSIFYLNLFWRFLGSHWLPQSHWLWYIAMASRRSCIVPMNAKSEVRQI